MTTDAKPLCLLAATLAAILVSPATWAADCPADRDKLVQALKASVKPSGGPSNGGTRQQRMGSAGDPRRRGLCGRFQRLRSDRPVAWQPCDRDRESEHGERPQSQRLRIVDRQSVRRSPARRLPFWARGDQSAERAAAVRRRSFHIRVRERSARRPTRWRRRDFRRGTRAL